MIKPVFTVHNEPHIRRVITDLTTHSVEKLELDDSDCEGEMHFNFKAESPTIRRAASNSPSEGGSTLKKMVTRFDKNPTEPSSFSIEI
jgi:hypothetical protein